MKLNPVTRAGAKPNDDMHEIRDHSAHSTKKACLACGCPECMDMQSRLDPAPAYQGADDDTDRNQAADIQAVLDRLQAKGALNSSEAQVAAAALAARPMRGYVG